MAYIGAEPIPIVVGGTGGSTHTAYAVICGGATATGALQSIAGLGSSGEVLTSNGAGALPTFQSAGGGGGISTINGNSGSATGAAVTFTGVSAGKTVTFSGASSTINLNVTDGDFNTGMGFNTLVALAGGQNNTFFGRNCASSLTTASNNVGLGLNALSGLVAGNTNISIGTNSGGNYIGESNNIVIGNAGTGGDNAVIRIGNGHNKCFISGIDGVSITGSAVLIDSSGQLGDVVSSRHFKENIQEIQDSEIKNLRPVKFNYISDKTKTTSYGLIAEEVEEVFPDLVIYKDGNPYSVKYHEMPALLLKEIQRLSKRIDELEAR